jgi:hypothetical protein
MAARRWCAGKLRALHVAAGRLNDQSPPKATSLQSGPAATWQARASSGICDANCGQPVTIRTSRVPGRLRQSDRHRQPVRCWSARPEASVVGDRLTARRPWIRHAGNVAAAITSRGCSWLRPAWACHRRRRARRRRWQWPSPPSPAAWRACGPNGSGPGKRACEVLQSRPTTGRWVGVDDRPSPAGHRCSTARCRPGTSPADCRQSSGRSDVYPADG